MDFHSFDRETGAYAGSGKADPHPFRPDEYVLPDCATFTAPPEAQEGFERVFRDGAWVQVAVEPEPEPPVPVDANIANAPSDLFGGPTLKGVFNGNL